MLSTRKSDSRYELQVTNNQLLLSDFLGQPRLFNSDTPSQSLDFMPPTRPNLSIILNFHHLKIGKVEGQELHTTAWKKFN